MSLSSSRPVRIALEGVDGVGKSNVIRRMRDELAADASVLYETMAPVTLDLLKSFGRDVYGEQQEYWTRVSRRTKTQVFLTEGVVRAEYLAGYYAGFDAVVYDRWWQTFAAYSDGEDDFDGRCRFLRDALPELDVVVYLRGATDVCAARLIAGDDWLTRQMPLEDVPGFLAGLQHRYDRLLMDDTRCVVETARRLVEDVAAEVVSAVRAALSARPATGARQPGAYSQERTQFATPPAEDPSAATRRGVARDCAVWETPWRIY
jgi:thymidylate kinase